MRKAIAEAVDKLERGRESYARRVWTDAYESLSLADRATPLGATDLELLATSAYMLGRDEEHVGGLERAHHEYVNAAEALRAARCAFWVGINLMLRGEMSRATGWLGRAQRLVEREDRDCVERGYLRFPAAMQHDGMGDYEAAYAIAGEAVEFGERFGDADLLALAVHEQGHALVMRGRVEEGLRLLDEAMVAVTAGELSPIVTGLVYCSVIDACQEVYALERAQEWTSALTRWCEEQPDMVAFTGRCLIHRAEIIQLHGGWGKALEEARRAGERFVRQANERAAGQALYRKGEVHRLRGEFPAAESAYMEASRLGSEPQPGLAQLRLAQGNGGAAAGAIRRVVDETSDELARAGLLPAYIEILLEVGDAGAARGACDELQKIAANYGSAMLAAMGAQARGALYLAEDDPGAALGTLRQACQKWQNLDVPYEAARTRELIGLACRALGDDDTGDLELAAARRAFEELGAAPDLARVDSLTSSGAPGHAHGLTARELEVLRLVAGGKTNKSIAADLVVSERTVDRHVSNIFAKLRVSSRAAATAFAYEHRLV